MAKKVPTITIHIPEELGLSSEEIARLGNIFQARLTQTLSAKGAETVPFIPNNTTSSLGTRSPERASRPRSTKKTSKTTRKKSSKKR
jgi:hypothetical protein